MSKSIKTYDDVVKEKQQLEILLRAQKELIISDLHGVKDSLQPAMNAFSIMGKLVTRESDNLLVNGGLNYLIDFVFRKVILSRAGWVTKLAVPFFIKNYSSHIVSEKKEKWLGRLFSWIGRHRSNGQHTEAS